MTVRPQQNDPGQDFRDFMRTGWSRARGPVTELRQARYHARRREALSAAFPGETIVVPTGQEQVRANDTHHRFRAGSDFAWLTGDLAPEGVLVLHPRASGHDAVLYRRPSHGVDSDEHYASPRFGELWVGRKQTLAETETALGVECRDREALESALNGLARRRVRVLRGRDAEIDARFPLDAPAEGESRDGRLAWTLADLRLTKDAWELEQLQEAIDATVRGFEDVARLLPSSGTVSERLLEGVFGTRARVEGNGVGYDSVVAAGANATTVHWTANTGRAAPGDLVLMDMGVEGRNLYTADITRTLPVSGSFTPVQREVYEIVLTAQQAGMDAIEPGVKVLAIREACMEVLAEGLQDLGLLPRAAGGASATDSLRYRRWTLHGFGHMLGIDVHDCGASWLDRARNGTVEENHVLTVEPGLYFQPNDELVPEELRGIGIRIEDDVHVTADGCRNLSAALPRAAGEVETWLAAQREAGPRFPTEH
ncbi:aminopeptidase P family protein [Glycomyces sp. TRM65418]|uniref:aminopeptidase P family protein n=1 Tax=Glycomyces sp. TRM65418 TaxID=2867006 RepID=UPI001CE55E9E|nr:aminopeptidase P family protein [Glycomyces sp. TRM65418]MCC3765511.1 aminopeptidase P family protein [Glycomyces sp. TRM65418]QZD55118.1 aminopeptidase P family protein [Glycomyces sp. TRM65418]